MRRTRKTPWRLAILTTFASLLGRPATSGPRASEGLVINEIVSDAARCGVDEDGDASDWLEIANLSADAVDLGGWTLTDDLGYVAKWRFPRYSLASGGHLRVWCSGKDRILPSRAAIEAGHAATGEVLVGSDVSWRYVAGGASDPGPPETWADPTFDDRQWAEGPPPFGFGEADVETALPPGTAALFLRHRFEADPSKIHGIVLRVRFDDGFACFLNGSLVASENVSTTERLMFGSRATSATEPQKHRYYDISDGVRGLVLGTNLLAIAVVNVMPSSEDLFIAPEVEVLEPVFHTNFRIASEGEVLLLSSPDGQSLSGIHAPALGTDRSFGRYPDGTGEYGHLLYPSPGRSNPGPLLTMPVPGDLHATLDRGYYGGPLTTIFGLDLPVPLELRFSIDGSRPMPESPILRGPIGVSGSSVVRVGGYLAGHEVVSSSARSYFVGGDRLTLPAIAVSVAPEDLLAVHLSAGGRGGKVERECYLEAFDPAGRAIAFGPAGLRLHGATIRPSKRQYRTHFREVYGMGRLRGALFTGAEVFDKLVFRGPDASSPYGTVMHPVLFEDQLVRIMHERLGGTTARGGWYHLFINMEHRGIYNVVERIDEEFLATRTGVAGWTVVKAGERISGSDAVWNELRTLATQPTTEESLARLSEIVDLVDFARFYALHVWFGNRDWAHNNWHAARIPGKTPWRFLTWDAEWIGTLSPEESVEHGMTTGFVGTLVRRLLGDPVFEETLLSEMQRAVHGELSSRAVIEEIETLRAILEPDMPSEVATIGGSLETWRLGVAELEEFCRGRDVAVFEALARSEQLSLPVALRVVPSRVRRCPGTTVVVKGVRLGPETRVRVGGFDAQVTQVGLEDLRIVVPEEALLGRYPDLRTEDPAGMGFTAHGLLELIDARSGFVRGDADGDGRLSMTDAVLTVLDAIGRRQVDGNCPAALDADESGEIDLSDAVRLLRYLFAYGDPPPPPYPACGPDSVGAPLPCDRECPPCDSR